MSIQRITDFLNRLCFAFVRSVIWPICPPRYFILFGGPGAGKGTLAKLLASKLWLAHLSTGDVFRKERRNQTELGLKLAGIEKGKFAPDDLTVAIVRKELMRWRCWHGAILDGFPRTLPQAVALAKLLHEWGVKSEIIAVMLDAEDEILVSRLQFRLTCKSCGRTYHLHTKPPKTPGICDVCKGELYQREDDTPEVIPKRLSDYKRESAPLVEYYRSGLVVVSITESMTEQDVFDAVNTALRARRS